MGGDGGEGGRGDGGWKVAQRLDRARAALTLYSKVGSGAIRRWRVHPRNVGYSRVLPGSRLVLRRARLRRPVGLRQAHLDAHLPQLRERGVLGAAVKPLVAPKKLHRVASDRSRRVRCALRWHPDQRRRVCARLAQRLAWAALIIARFVGWLVIIII
jgi:hypothetical protein